MTEINLDLTTLTRGERLYLWRRRQASPTGRRRGRGGSWMSANEAAAMLGLDVHDYQTAERDEAAPSYTKGVLKRAVNGERPSPTLGELCLIAKRRAGAGATVSALCAELRGVSKPTLHKMERAGDPEVVDLWRRRGFRFPDVT